MWDILTFINSNGWKPWMVGDKNEIGYSCKCLSSAIWFSFKMHRLCSISHELKNFLKNSWVHSLREKIVFCHPFLHSFLLPWSYLPHNVDDTMWCLTSGILFFYYLFSKICYLKYFCSVILRGYVFMSCS